MLIFYCIVSACFSFKILFILMDYVFEHFQVFFASVFLVLCRKLCEAQPQFKISLLMFCALDECILNIPRYLFNNQVLRFKMTISKCYKIEY